jgi:phage-related baseplate assembly protein
MADPALTYLASLPKPKVIEELDFETILADRKADLVARMQDFGIDYSVEMLETDAAIIQLREASFREVQLRGLGNDIARARYRAFATGADLDHLAEFYGVIRLDGENDERLNMRVTLAQQGASVAGPEAYFQRLAMGASIRVADVKVWREDVLPILHVSVLSTDNNGVADAELLGIVREAVAGDAARPMTTGTIIVEAGVKRLINVAASVTLLTGTAEALLDAIEAGLPATWAAIGDGGRDLTLDWIKAQIMVPGVYGATITSPAVDQIADDKEWLRIGTVALTPGGRAY